MKAMYRSGTFMDWKSTQQKDIEKARELARMPLSEFGKGD